MARPFFAAVLLLPLLVTLAPPSPSARAGEIVPDAHHDLRVVLHPAEHLLEVVDVVSPRTSPADGEALRFRLNAALTAEAGDAAWVVEAVDGGGEGAPGEESGENGGVGVGTWAVRPRDGPWPRPPKIPLRYRGTIHQPPRAEGEDYARSFARTAGTIGEEGAVLTRATVWVPDLGEDLLTFRLEVDLPAGWDAVSQGRRTKHAVEEGRRFTTWESPHPMEEVYLIANRFTEYDRPAGRVRAQAFLREPDPALAGRYLEATAQYLALYERLIGPYPFGKFALVENFWETGYGMPSFTLLGPQVIRLPFILHSSYPHEILHNWWGNSVYVDWQTGNWCEGLTAYLADHLLREGQGRGTEYRRDTLKKYRNHVRGARDFPLTQFRSRHSGATEAVGYGKSLMLFHMLRRHLGDETFVRGLRTFYRKHRWTKASFADLADVFSEVSGEDLHPFFRQWVERTGAPALALRARREGKGKVLLEIAQTQAGDV
ncbi:MAG: M1 family metallopeptidase, partial [Planctomycetota bacterium]